INMKRLKELRLNKNLTQQQLGKLLSVSGQTILNWENDITYPSVKKLIELASFFDVSIDYLLDFKEKDTNFDKIINILNDYEKEDLIKLIATFVNEALNEKK
ncbi:MAG: helix-turn-helix transcriptional regulator, partial [Candidatus Onthovivens sp.]|nr:helix-turn-helix transcriptional regulator [Candidatus Onthovivens sp.]